MDMVGNAIEWVADKYDDPGAAERVLRGGAWVLPWADWEVRYRGPPDIVADSFGFRPAK
jgi:formylglycine-generating enzyme required for sulfatase activity